MSHGSPQPSSSRVPTERTPEALGLLDVVRVRHALPRWGLAGGEQGTIVEIVDQPTRAYLVDFSGGSADPAETDVPVFFLTADQIVLVWRAS